MSIMQSGVVEVKLTRGLVTVIDAEDLELVSQHKWCARQGGNTYYALGKHDGKKVLLHRFLVNALDGIHVDHINHDGLDNRRGNLRLCTRSENLRNSQKHKGCISEFKGVTKRPDGRRKPWEAQIYVNKKKYRRFFFTELEAALCYDEMAKEHFGEFAKLNFP